MNNSKLIKTYSLYGPAPLQHMILQGRQRYSITVQTMDKKAFDRGLILAQTGTTIPNSDDITYEELLTLVIPKASRMLIEALRMKVYVKPYLLARPEVQNEVQSLVDQGQRVHAHKIETEHKQIGVRPWNSLQIDRQFRAFGRLWMYAVSTHGDVKRILFDEMKKLRYHRNDTFAHGFSITDLEGRGSPHYLKLSEQGWKKCKDRLQHIPYIIDGKGIILCTPHHPEKQAGSGDKTFDDRSWVLRVEEMTIAGENKTAAKSVVERLH